MRTNELKDLAPEFKVKNSGWMSRWYTWTIVIVLGVAIVWEAAPLQRSQYVIEKTPGIGELWKKLNEPKPKQ
jgi:hypothetical protein